MRTNGGTIPGAGAQRRAAFGCRRRLVFAALALATVAHAQDDVAGDGAGGQEAPQAMVRSLPADLMPLTPKGLLLDVQNTGKHLFAVGDRGAILVSNDGVDWAQVPAPTRSALTALQFVDEDHAWAVGHDAVILHTADGGRSWQLQNFEPELERPFLDLQFVDTQTGVAVGAYGLLYRTTDSGQTWAEVDTPIREDEWHFNAISRLQDGSLLICGESGMLARSQDAGETWERIDAPYDSSLFGAVPVGARGALLYGLRGHVFLTDDVTAGQWRALETDTVATMFGASALADGRVALVGLNGQTLVVDTASGAVQRGRSASGTGLSSAIAFAGHLLAVGESGVQHIPLTSQAAAREAPREAP